MNTNTKLKLQIFLWIFNYFCFADSIYILIYTLVDFVDLYLNSCLIKNRQNLFNLKYSNKLGCIFCITLQYKNILKNSLNFSYWEINYMYICLTHKLKFQHSHKEFKNLNYTITLNIIFDSHLNNALENTYYFKNEL